ncbi:MAG: hypothetical protein V4611_03760 [Patescibacteria group bacterium]
MFSSQFDQVYGEAFHSATGEDFDSPEVRARHDAYVAPVEEALIDHWTDGSVDISQPISDVYTSRGASVFRLRHPNTAEFTEEDARDIAHIRYLGHAIIEVAQKYAPSPENERDIYSRNLSYRYWYNAHPELDRDQDFSADPDCASPLRLEQWPKGEYLNCLGVSIALSGQEAREAENPYFYVNRLRNSAYEGRLQFLNVFRYLRSVHPSIVNQVASPLLVGQHAKLAEAVDIQTDLKEVLDGERPIEMDRNFHHSILTSGESSWRGTWTQVDPYGAVYNGLSPMRTATATDHLLSGMDAGTCNEVIVYDSDMIDYKFASAMKVAREASELGEHLLEALNGNYKSEHYFENIREEIAVLVEAAWMSRSFDPTDESRDYTPAELLGFAAKPDRFRIMGEQADAYWIMILIQMRMIMYTQKDKDGNPGLDTLASSVSAKLFKGNTGKHHKSGFLNYFDENRNEVIESIQLLQDSMKEDLKYHARLRDALRLLVEALPYQVSFELLYRQASAKFGYESDQAMEISDPEFTIGMMYMNHYATWRKDGKINIAKELARISPSQLIWQAAVAREPEAHEDERVRSVGKLVTSLKNDQLHPLVRLTIPMIKE